MYIKFVKHNIIINFDQYIRNHIILYDLHYLVPHICTCDAPKVDFSRLAAFTIEFVKILPTSVDIVTIRRKSAEERTRVDSRRRGPKGRYRGIQSGKSQASRSRTEGFKKWPERIYGNLKS